MLNITPEILQCGLYDLNKGDKKQNACADEVRKQVFLQAGLMYEHGWGPADQACSGYYAGGEHAWVDGNGKWRGAHGDLMAAGEQLYLDFECTIPLPRTT